MSAQPPPAPRTSGLAQIFRALRHRNYRLFFVGQGISLVGNWMTQFATLYLVYAITASPFLLGLVGFAGQFPAFVLTPWAGVMVDRWNRRRALVVTQILAAAQSLALAALALSGAIAYWHLVALAVLQALINAFDIPARQTFVLDMVERKEDLGNAIALNSLLFNGSRFVGPSVAGGIVTLFGGGIRGAGWCYLLDGCSYLAVIACLLAMRIRGSHLDPPNGKVWHGLVEGFRYAFHSPPIRTILLAVATVSFAGMPYFTLLPVFAVDVFHGDAHTQGYLMSAVGLGALAGALRMASHPGVVPFSGRIPAATALFAAGVMGFSLAGRLWLALPLLMLAGAGMMTAMATCNAVLQTIADADKRGRVVSLYTMAFIGMLPLGNLAAGKLAAMIGAPATLLIGGAICLITASVFASRLPALREVVRPIYRRIETAGH